MRVPKSSPRLVPIALAVTLGLGLFTGSGIALPTNTLTVTVDCGAGRTVSDALGRGAEGQSLVLVIQGTCNENVRVVRNDVTLQADPTTGGGVNGPDPSNDTITVIASRVTVDGLTVTGGRNGITGEGASRLTILNCVVQSGRTGIRFLRGANGTVDGCTLQGNPLDGVAIEAANATITNNSIIGNSRAGILVTDGGSARIGVTNLNAAAGNTISGNGSDGIHLSIGATAFVAANTISGNGTNPAAPLGRFGIGVFHASGDIIGGNAITGNASHGIFARSSSLTFGDSTFGISTVNTITGNGTAVTSAGIFGFLGTSFEIRNATISSNNGFGVVLSLRSTAEMAGNTIQNNTGTPPFSGDGIRLTLGSALFPDGPPAVANTVTGNAGFGINCNDPQSIVVNTLFVVLSPPANGLGGVTGCVGF